MFIEVIKKDGKRVSVNAKFVAEIIECVDGTGAIAVSLNIGVGDVVSPEVIYTKESYETILTRFGLALRENARITRPVET